MFGRKLRKSRIKNGFQDTCYCGCWRRLKIPGAETGADNGKDRFKERGISAGLGGAWSTEAELRRRSGNSSKSTCLVSSIRKFGAST